MSVKPLIYVWQWHLSHTVRRNRAKNGIETTPAAPSREQNESGARGRAFEAGISDENDSVFRHGRA
jgi:hypothetical protein